MPRPSNPLAALDGPETLAAVVVGLARVVDAAADRPRLPRHIRAWLIELSDSLAPVHAVALRVPRADAALPEAPAIRHEVH